MNSKKVLTTFLLFSTVFAIGQTSFDGFFPKKGKLSLTTSYTRTSYDEFYVGKEITSPVPAHNEVNQNIYTLYGTYAVSDNLGIIVNFPYFAAEGDGEPDPINGKTEQNDIQDINIYGKYRFAQSKFNGGSVDYLTALGFTIPTGYQSNGILSIGSGSFNTNLHAGAQLNTNLGLFASVLAGYSFRGEADDDFGTNGGEDFDVPDAFLFTGKIGYATSNFYVDGYVNYQASTDGWDLTDPNFGGRFPESKVSYTLLGISAYVPVTQLIGVSAGYGTVIDGRNIGDTNFFNFGLTFNIHTASKIQ